MCGKFEHDEAHVFIAAVVVVKTQKNDTNNTIYISPNVVSTVYTTPRGGRIHLCTSSIYESSIPVKYINIL